MSATATDAIYVLADTWQDAHDKARRQWEREGITVLVVVSAVAVHGAVQDTWKVTAVVRVGA